MYIYVYIYIYTYIICISICIRTHILRGAPSALRPREVLHVIYLQLFIILDLRVSSLRRGHANLLCTSKVGFEGLTLVSMTSLFARNIRSASSSDLREAHELEGRGARLARLGDLYTNNDNTHNYYTSLSLSVYIYIYISISLSLSPYIYIYIYTHRLGDLSYCYYYHYCHYHYYHYYYYDY